MQSKWRIRPFWMLVFLCPGLVWRHLIPMPVTGNFGTEEGDIIEPAVKQVQKLGIKADGPHPADTIFVRAQRGEFDAVVTMYHDQGQIAMKLMGFDHGVTVLEGFLFRLRLQLTELLSILPERAKPTLMP